MSQARPASHAAQGSWRFTPAALALGVAATWQWPVAFDAYDRGEKLTPAEREALALLAVRRGRNGHWPRGTREALVRLRTPILDVMSLIGTDENRGYLVLKALMGEMHRRQQTFWAWSASEWTETLCPSSRDFEERHGVGRACRPQLIALAYLLGPPLDLEGLGPFDRLALARKVFGRPVVDGAIRRVAEVLVGWGYRDGPAQRTLHAPVCVALLANRSPRLEDLTLDLLNDLRGCPLRKHLRNELYVLARALFGLGIIDGPPKKTVRPDPRRDPTVGLAPAWVAWCQRWLETSTLSPKVRQAYYLLLLKAGRWVASERPEITEPAHWTREAAAAYVAAVDRMVIGQWADTRHLGAARIGRPLSAKAKVHHLAALSAFFRDAQEWGWLPRHFDPRRSFAVPRTIRALVGPNPRVLADDMWAKLLWAGLNLEEADLSRSYLSTAHYYPLPMVRALAVVWLFGGLRRDEIHRLPVGCVRWQREDVLVVASDEVLPQEAVCLLDVPVHKTGTAFTKPVDPVVGEAIAAWEEARPDQPPLVDRKTGEAVQFLFAYRGQRLGSGYLNGTLIPLLCRKAGVARSDARGDITSHRARSTIASQLFNAKEPMSLFELQAWLGHRWPASTQHYAQVTPTRLAKAYADAGYFGRNLRAIEVLIDRGAVESGAAAAGEPWKLYDLGHGYCTYDFFDRCPHRMACAKCAFYEPKTSARSQLIEGKANLLRLRQEIPLLDDEREAVDDGVEAMDALLARLADEPTPDGGLPRRSRARSELPVLSAEVSVRVATEVRPLPAPTPLDGSLPPTAR